MKKVKNKIKKEIGKEIQKEFCKDDSFSSCCDSNCYSKKDICKGGVIYGLGIIGAAIYYIQTSTTFWMGVWGIIKAILWPAFLIFEGMKFLGM